MIEKVMIAEEVCPDTTHRDKGGHDCICHAILEALDKFEKLKSAERRDVNVSKETGVGELPSLNVHQNTPRNDKECAKHGTKYCVPCAEDRLHNMPMPPGERVWGIDEGKQVNHSADEMRERQEKSINASSLPQNVEHENICITDFREAMNYRHDSHCCKRSYCNCEEAISLFIRQLDDLKNQATKSLLDDLEKELDRHELDYLTPDPPNFKEVMLKWMNKPEQQRSMDEIDCGCDAKSPTDRGGYFCLYHVMKYKIAQKRNELND